MSVNRGKNWVEVSRGAIQRNVAALKKKIGPEIKFMAVVKSNAYGHGLELTVKALRTRQGVDWFGVDSLEEAKVVRAAGARQPVLIMGYVPDNQLRDAVKSGFSLVAYDIARIKKINRAATGGMPAKIHLKLETGTARQGILPDELPAVAKVISRCEHVWVEGAYTHYADVEDTEDSGFAMQQLSCYKAGLAVLAEAGINPELRHTAASAAALLHPETRLDLVRVGIAMYGQWPSDNIRRKLQKNLRLEPAMTFKASVAQVKSMPVGTPVGYGLTEVLKRNSRLAVVTAGYYDGYDRGLSSCAHLLIRGHRAKILGRVCMNMVVADVTDIKSAQAGDEVVLVGKQGRAEISADEIGNLTSTINYEVVTRVNPLLPRVAVV